MINSRRLDDLKPLARVKCIEFMAECERAGIKVQVIQTLRDSAYQAYLYQQGRTRPGKVVTWKDGVKAKSEHQSGLAFDAVPLGDKGGILWTDRVRFKKMAEIGKSLGLRCGFYFKSVDSPHFELT